MSGLYEEWTHTCGGKLKVLLDSEDEKSLAVFLLCSNCSWKEKILELRFDE